MEERERSAMEWGARRRRSEGRSRRCRRSRRRHAADEGGAAAPEMDAIVVVAAGGGGGGGWPLARFASRAHAHLPPPRRGFSFVGGGVHEVEVGGLAGLGFIWEEIGLGEEDEGGPQKKEKEDEGGRGQLRHLGGPPLGHLGYPT